MSVWASQCWVVQTLALGAPVLSVKQVQCPPQQSWAGAEWDWQKAWRQGKPTHWWRLCRSLQKLVKWQERGRTRQGHSSNPPCAVGVWLGYPSQKAAREDRNWVEDVDFNELPPVKGTGRSMAQAVDGQVVVVVVAPDLMQSRRLIPDLATWLQCFGLFTAAVARSKPERVPNLMAYMTIIARASQKYRWPGCVIYDQNFRLKVAGNAAQSWARVDPSIYAQPLLTYPILATLLIGHIQLSWMEVGPD